MQRFLAVDNVCAWPNLTILPGGDIVAIIHNQPTHGGWDGDVDCYASEDGGETWRLRGTPAPHEPGTVRMNVAAGLTRSGDLITLVSGWDDRGPVGVRRDHGKPVANCLRAWVCRSSDGGRSWQVDRDAFPGAIAADRTAPIPFGDILPGDGETLCACGYDGRLAGGGFDGWANYFFVSEDDGRTWGEAITIAAEDHNETTPLHLGGGRWIAAARTGRDTHLDLYRSDDNGATWRLDQPVSLPSQHPAQLLRLADDRVLLTYGSRCRGHFGVMARASSDEGNTWSAPTLLVQYPATDSGYPSTVQREDGKLVTAYYAGAEPGHDRYHMGAVVWEIGECF